MQRSLVAIVLIPFSVLSTVALWQYGYLGIFANEFQSTAGMQVLADLVIALSLFLVWMWHDAKATGRNPWPWLVVTLTMGSFGPLVYLLTRPSEETAM
ncbi:DUF2834 domain-containing protein [Nodosilinea sp. LEGE 07298]|uniref:DUF2834 domain-containing protein n=1 Tax=Nodosilinea sp. LEGE 07298 TaxID=2777970 RepID=UPI0018805A08|nr:DUF2834 domain-containing protein [Nodosilinea sp. LEGE 07298]MBE9113556.1 DUF2834 domain-containing protein [Nodosilinea sp. LEGE 07298]